METKRKVPWLNLIGGTLCLVDTVHTLLVGRYAFGALLFVIGVANMWVVARRLFT